MDHAEKIRADLFKMRTSVSTTSFNYLDFSKPLKKNSSAAALFPKKYELPQSPPSSNIKKKLE
jgi:hypothetical protein